MGAPSTPPLPSSPEKNPAVPPTISAQPAAPERATPGRPYRYRGEGTGAWQVCAWTAGRIVSRFLSLILFRLHVRGQADLPKTGGVLMVTNHQSFLDPWLIGIALSRQV